MTDTTGTSLVPFVRGTLGCRCPDEVFQSVATSRMPAGVGHPAVVQLVIGARLLIHIVALPPDPAQSGWIERLAAAGQVARDRAGCNRFRLVVAAPAATMTPDHLTERFARAIEGDDRAHLHLLSPDLLPDAVWPAGA